MPTIRTSEKQDQLWDAVAKAQSSVPMIEKDKRVKFQSTNFAYVGLPGVWEKIKKGLDSHNLIALQSADQDEITTRIIHTPSGQWYEADSPIFVTLGGKTKETFGAQTIARRYGIMTALFVVSADDSDADAMMSYETQRREQTGYYDDALHWLISKGMNQVEAKTRLDEELGNIPANEQDRPTVLKAAQRAMGNGDAEDPMLEGRGEPTFNEANAKAGVLAQMAEFGITKAEAGKILRGLEGDQEHDRDWWADKYSRAEEIAKNGK